MIAMRYRIALPADYPMEIIERRIAERGHLTDGLPGLGLKAYLYSRAGEDGGAANAYAPFYLWRTSEGMRDFLSGPGFAALCASFGRPAVESAFAWFGEWRGDVAEARYAMVEKLPMAASAGMDALRDVQEGWRGGEPGGGDVLAVAAAFDPASWTLVRLSLSRRPFEPDGGGARELYRVGRVSLG
ncbi:DUF4865 family protein [Chromobacterium vaccinii]|uniref:DUF4865 domain-containing protein n=1 Tax=Chromobacterium vaccinii TaxID=1108595 RepID=A0A1D9LEV1_9NEIS|nr:DUF4865 family protein [Chromobacterium vaccinii]AOZ49797.1 hypothetical protein BKX93_07175 [Chromobacterium vaccinii]QND84103.1 Uncharacterized protein ChrSW_1876 [Chromobacterium vaccinii]QND89334.1 Uncharacterized protein ChrSV_1876 [Chromobacterium vaccinii]